MVKRAELWIRGATVYDGTGAPPRALDLALRGDRIARVAPPGDTGDWVADRSLDGAGLALAPGFIDVHTHDDFALLARPEMDFKVLGGVTTVVVGNCGMGAAPWRIAMLFARAFHPNGRFPEWDGYAGYVARLGAEPPSTNAALLIGHGTARASVMGNEKRAPTERELDAMRAVVREGIEAGAVGLSTGLVYEPGRYAAIDEIAALARELRDSGGLYATHMRNEGTGLLDSVREAIEIGRRAGVPVQISHHKASGRDAWGKVGESLALIERAQAEGLDVHADQYPYTAGSTVLAAVVQNGAFGDRPAVGLGKIAPEDVSIASAPGHPEWEGQSIAQLCQSLGQSALAAAEHVVAAAPGVTVVMHTMSEDDVRTVMRHPSTMIGSDGIPTLPGKPHPRLWGTFARVLGRYARELGLFPLEEGIHRMTGFPARKFGLRERGVIREGAFADLVLFDPARIVDRGSYEDPNHPPAGIRDVLVNGSHVVRDGVHTGARPGRALRRGAA
ncbi:MAG TPA: D-aminoacylase [Myxococcota bacterium]|nr:D-aminoacylase [Myxococcota bacterium]